MPQEKGDIEKLELYRHFPPRKAKDINITELEKCKYLLSVMTIAPILKVYREKKFAMRILEVIDYGVYICINRVYFDVFK